MVIYWKQKKRERDNKKETNIKILWKKENVALQGYEKVFSEIRVRNFEVNFEEYLSQNSQFRKTLSGSFTQIFEELFDL